MTEITNGIMWSDKYKLGDEYIDAQHRRLFEMVNELVGACLDGTETEKIQGALGFLVDYTIYHFSSEEALQLKCRYPGYDRHRQMHEQFKEIVGALVERFRASGSSVELSNDVSRIVIRWLVNHILGEDKKIGEHMRNVGD